MPQCDSTPRLITPGVIANELHEPLHRVLNVLATRQHIQPAARAGTLRFYDRKAVALVRHELTAIDARRCEQEVSHGSQPHRAPPRVPAELPTDPDELRSVVRDLMAYVADCYAESRPHGITRFVPPTTAKLDEMVNRVVAQHLADENHEVSRA